MAMERIAAGFSQEQQREMSIEGFKVFMHVSYKYPASVYAQGIMIAQMCNEKEIHPYALSPFIYNEELVAKFIKVAEAVHARRGKSVSISREDVVSILKSELSIAHDAQFNLYPDQIGSLIGFADELYSNASCPVMEIDDLIKDRFESIVYPEEF